MQNIIKYILHKMYKTTAWHWRISNIGVIILERRNHRRLVPHPTWLFLKGSFYTQMCVIEPRRNWLSCRCEELWKQISWERNSEKKNAQNVTNIFPIGQNLSCTQVRWNSTNPDKNGSWKATKLTTDIGSMQPWENRGYSLSPTKEEVHQ